MAACPPLQALTPLNTRVVWSAPIPRSTIPLFITRPVVRSNMPEPSCTYWPAEQLRIAELIFSANAPAAIVEPHWVQESEGIPPTTPALVQSIARLGSRIPNQAWAFRLPLIKK